MNVGPASRSAIGPINGHSAALVPYPAITHVAAAAIYATFHPPGKPVGAKAAAVLPPTAGARGGFVALVPSKPRPVEVALRVRKRLVRVAPSAAAPHL